MPSRRPDLEYTSAGTPRHGFFVRLYTGTGAFEVIGRRKLLVHDQRPDRRGRDRQHRVPRVHLRHRLRGRHQGVDARRGENGTVSVEQVEDVFSQALGKAPDSVVIVGSGDSATVQIRSETLDNAEIRSTAHRPVRRLPAQEAPTASPASRPSATRRCPRRGAGRSPKKALIALIVFLVLAPSTSPCGTSATWRSSALTTLFFDLVVTAGVYSLVGFEVTPGHGDRPAHDSRLLAVRHRHRVRQGRGEHARLRAHHPTHLRRACQPGDQPDLHAVDQHQPDLGAADPRR